MELGQIGRMEVVVRKLVEMVYRNKSELAITPLLNMAADNVQEVPLDKSNVT